MSLTVCSRRAAICRRRSPRHAHKIAQWTADGPSTASVPKVVAVAFKPERAPILRPRMAVPAVKAKRVKCATRKLAQVQIIDLNVQTISSSLALHAMLTRCELTMKRSLIHPHISTHAHICSHDAIGFLTRSRTSQSRLVARGSQLVTTSTVTGVPARNTCKARSQMSLVWSNARSHARMQRVARASLTSKTADGAATLARRAPKPSITAEREASCFD